MESVEFEVYSMEAWSMQGEEVSQPTVMDDLEFRKGTYIVLAV